MVQPYCVQLHEFILSITADTYLDFAGLRFSFSLLPICFFCLQLDEAVRRGPYLARKNSEAQPAVMTAERF